MINKLYFTETDKKMLSRLKEELQNMFKSGDSVAIKLHMGEKYNPNHLQPEFVRKVVRLMTSMNMKPFLFDSPTMYEGPRHTADGYKKQAAGLGFSEDVVGCPVVVSEEFVESKGKHMTYQVCRHLAEAEGVLVLTHFKGHALIGVGGAIKNLGMGALTRKSKKDVHDGGKPVYGKGCALCKKCLEVCVQKCIKYDENGPIFDYENCYGCSKCAQNCPRKCLKPRVAEFDALLADGANAALKTFKKVYYINVLRRITNVCDCSSRGLRVVCPDIGVVMGGDACAIDRVSVELVNRRMGRELFTEMWLKSPLVHIEEAEKLGMGSSEYGIEDA